MRRPRLEALTGLRFVGAAAIVVHHWSRLGIAVAFAQRVVLDQAVSFFFLLSGFVLLYTHPTFTPGDAGRFLRVRLARLWPVHLVAFLLVLALLPAREWSPGRGTSPVWTAVANLALVQAWVPSPDYYFSYNGPSWSLSVEATFYVVFVLVAGRFARTWPLLLAATIALTAGVLKSLDAQASPALFAMAYVHPLARLLEFVLGMTLALAWPRIDAARPGPVLGTALEATAVALLAAAMWYTHDLARALAAAGVTSPAAMVWFTHGGATCPFFLLLIAVIGKRCGVVSWLLSSRPLVALGETSLAIYLLHHVLLRAYAARIDVFATLPWPVVLAAYWTILLIAARLTWRFVEQPARRLVAPDRPAVATGADCDR